MPGGARGPRQGRSAAAVEEPLPEADAQKIEKIIIAPEFVPLLLATPSGKRLGALAERLTRKPVWVRHDEHFHLDFVENGGGGR